jgi:GT2 family glycosyltransferase
VASFSSTLIPAAAFRTIGLIDERLGMYYEDTECCLRARKAGYRILLQPDAIIYHKEGGSSGGGWNSPFTQYYASRNRPYVMRKHRSTAAYARFTLYYLATRLLWLGLDVARRNWPLLRAHLLGLRDFYLSRMGMRYAPSDLNDSRDEASAPSERTPRPR